MLIIYHANCSDGFCAAWIAKKAWPEAKLYPAKHGEPAPNVAGEDVIIADFSYDRETLTTMHAAANSLIVLDHHESAEAKLSGLPFCVFDIERSGARLMWEYVCKRSDVNEDNLVSIAELTISPDEHLQNLPPWLVVFTEDRDLWRWKLENSREVNAAIRSYPYTIEAWDAMAEKGPDALAAEGTAILRYRTRLVDAAVADARDMLFDGEKVPAVNCTIKELSSDIAERLLEGGAKMAVVWRELASGGFAYELRSKGGADVSVIATRYGGGGHKHAAGFTSVTQVLLPAAYTPPQQPEIIDTSVNLFTQNKRPMPDEGKQIFG